jgi:hypothetical protein
MAFPNLTYTLAGNMMTGQIANRSIQFHLHPARGGMPAPGNYRIYPPVNHQLYGTVALMLPAATSSGPSPMSRNPAQGFQYEPGRAYQYVSNRGFQYASNGAFQYDSNRAYQYDSNHAYQYDSNRSFQYEPRLAPEGGQSFLLSPQAIPGQNCLVIAFGAADLMNALRAEGGALVRVG